MSQFEIETDQRYLEAMQNLADEMIRYFERGLKAGKILDTRHLASNAYLTGFFIGLGLATRSHPEIAGRLATALDRTKDEVFPKLWSIGQAGGATLVELLADDDDADPEDEGSHDAKPR